MTPEEIFKLIEPCRKRSLTLTILPDKSVNIEEHRFLRFEDAFNFVHSIMED